MTGETQPLIESTKAPTLRRTRGAFRLTLYGLGAILGAGIYVLTGEDVGAAGMAAPPPISARLRRCRIHRTFWLSYWSERPGNAAW